MSLRWPRKTLTIVVTDIVSSTATAVRLGDREWRERLETHSDIVRARASAHHGQELWHTGDGFVFAFTGSHEAVAAACEASIEVPRLELALRIGIDKGRCRRWREIVHGSVVEQARALAGAAHPGEVLISAAVLDSLRPRPVSLVRRSVEVDVDGDALEGVAVDRDTWAR